ncbi:rab3 GTPase-activating protein catalytic subunit [Atheta coriaria]|uniref:rab3 GTPase-activating protein catalytic subunit n=1 Tax=Dalotia coriaria TaxID=877792 RepID=UPI0031F33D0C
MNEEIDESEFYHQDFTTASEWEVFIARLEEIIHEWKIEDNKADSICKEEGIWRIKTENIPFADVEFTFTYYSAKCEDSEEQDEEAKEELEFSQHPMQNSFDFTLRDIANEHEDILIYYWYGLHDYIVLSPVNNSNVVSESRIKILLSSANIAIGNSNCEIPIFIQVREKWQKYYLGVFESDNVRTNFEMVHLRRGPQHCQYLTGLTDLFKTKIMSPIQLEPIIVSVKFSYLLNDFGTYIWKQDAVDCDVENFDANAVVMLPLGVTIDPVESLLVKAQWSQMPDNLIVDSESYTNFEPMQAPKWTVFANFADKPICLLADCLSEFVHLLKNAATVYDVLGDFAVQPAENTNPLDLLTEPRVPTISSVLKRAARNSLTKSSHVQRKGLAPLPEEVLVPMLYFLFPDAEENSPHVYFTNKKDGIEEDPAAIDEKYKGFKTCKVDSLVWRLSIILCHALYSLGGARAVAHIWFEFVQEMRYRWERSIMIPGLAPGFPDARTCLLHQKLQMLNCCIERKKSRESAIVDKEFESFDEGNSSEEEFFDADDEQLSEEQKSRQRYLPWNQPVGRLGKFESMKLIKTGNQLYIPITQEPVPKTEDQLEEYTDILLKLGSDAQGSELRARMMSASLLSDMESFKAANPGSILEDFIRWYSPRDWIEDEEEDEWGQPKGHLSSRMLIANNTWVETWNSAKAVPANRQRRLFDDTREAEKVLHFLDSRTLSQISELLLPVLSHSSLARVEDECVQLNIPIKNSSETLQHLTKTVERLSREGKINTRRYELLVQELIPLELALAQGNSLLYKLNPEGSHDEELSLMVSQMIRSKEVEIVGKEQSKAGARILSMFTEAQKVSSLGIGEVNLESLQTTSAFPQPHEREFVMRVNANRPAVYSNKSVQFLRALLSKNEFRLCGAFSEDITFF